MWLLRTCISSSNSTMIFLIVLLTTLLTSLLAQTTSPLLTTTSNDVQHNNCPEYWFGDENTCYFVSDFLTSWKSAREFCYYLESDLIIIISNGSIANDMMIYSSLPSITLKDIWIGLSDLNSPGNFKWVDESEPMFTDWLNDTDSANGNCVMLDVENQKWKVENCSAQHGFACSKQGMFNESFDVLECEGGMKRFANSCYWTVPGENNWQSAENWCETENGNLTTISNSLENIFVYSFVRQQIGAYWIGLHVDDSGLKWQNGEQDETYFNWDGKPEILSGLCAVMERNGKWLMQPCSGNQITSAICEKPVSNKNFPTSRIGTVNIPSCPPSWEHIEDKCYLVVTVPMTWDGAHNQCTSLGGDLVSFKSQHDEMLVLNLTTNSNGDSIGNNFWLGLRLFNSSDRKDWKWNDQSPLTYTNWNFIFTHENISSEVQKFCAVFEVITKRWTIEPCSLTAIFVCEAPAGHWNLSCDDESCQPPSTQVEITTSQLPIGTVSPFFGTISTQDADDYYPKTNPCPPEWQIFDDKCYLIKGDMPFEYANWTRASYLCRSKGDGYDLVSIHSAIEHEFLLNELKSLGMERAWIGLNDKAIEGQFVWSDGSTVDYTDWAWREMLNANPNNFTTTVKSFTKMTDDCVKIEMTGIAGKWTASNCNVKVGYICQKTFRSSMISTPPVPFPPILTTTKEEILNPVVTELNQFESTNVNTKPSSSIIPNDIIQDENDEQTYEDTTSITQRTAHTWKPEAGSSLGISHSSDIENNEVSPFDVDDLVTAKCKCESESRMTSGTIAGITLSCLLAAVLLVIAYFHWRRRRVVTTVGSGKFSFDNALYNPHADHIQLDTNVPPTSTYN